MILINYFPTLLLGEIKVILLKDITFEIKQGEVVVIVGASGAGKTTITQALYGQDIEYHKTQYINYSKYIH